MGPSQTGSPVGSQSGAPQGDQGSAAQPGPHKGKGKGKGKKGEVVTPPCDPCAKAKIPCIRETESACVRCFKAHDTCNLGGRVPRTQAKKAQKDQALGRIIRDLQLANRAMEQSVERTLSKFEEKRITSEGLAVMLEETTERIGDSLDKAVNMLKKFRDGN